MQPYTPPIRREEYFEIREQDSPTKMSSIADLRSNKALRDASIEVVKYLGSGTFGNVFEAKW
jgi:hypothetical protein